MKPSVKSAPARRLSLALPPHMLMKPVTFSASSDEKEEATQAPVLQVPESISEDKNSEPNFRSSASSLWSDENSPTKKPKKLNRFRLRLTDPLKFLESNKPTKTSSEKTKEISQKQSSGAGSMVEKPETTSPDSGFARKAVTPISQKDSSGSDSFIMKPDTTTSTDSGIIRKALQDFQENSSRQEKKNSLQPSLVENYITGFLPYPPPHLKSIRCLPSFEVTVVNIHSPSHFGFTFSRNQLQALHTEMAMHYSVAEGIEVENPVVGMPVAVAVDDNWYRAEVLYVNPSDVLILFVDLGLRKYVNTRELRYLERSFAGVSRKACRGRLFGVQPAEGEDEQWSAEATAFFTQKIKNTKLKATVKAVKDGYYELSLVNIDDHSKVAEDLVRLGFAEKVKGLDNSLVAILV